MSGGLNKVLVIGNVGKDPEIKETTVGAKVATFSVAVNKSWRDKNSGEKRDHTEWIRVVVFNENLVTVIEKYVHKGSKLYVEGEYRTRKWEKDGVDHYSTEVVLSAFGSKIILLDKSEGGGRPAPSEDDYGTTKTRQVATTAKEDLDDEIPF